MRFHKLFFYLIVILILTPTTFYSTPQDVFGVSRIVFDNVDSSLGTSEVCVVNALDVAVGDVVVLVAGDGDDATNVATVSDEDSNVWTLRITADDNNSFSSQFMWTAVIDTANASNDITITWVGQGNFICGGAVYNGVDNNDPVQATNFTMCDNIISCAVAITPNSIDNIMVGSCQSDWNNGITHTFDSTATGTERYDLGRAGGDNMENALIDMFTFTDTTSKDWTCDDNRSNRDLSVQMLELNSAPLNPQDPITMTDVVNTNYRFLQDPMNWTEAVSFDTTRNERLLTYYEEVVTCVTNVSSTTDIITVTDGTEFDFISGRSYLIMASLRFNSLDISSSEEVRMLHGSTEFEGSDFNMDPQNGSAVGCTVGNPMYSYAWFTVWEPTGAEADENIILQIVPSANDATYDQGQVVVIEISERFDKNQDWFFNEQTTDNGLGLSWDTADDATITFTPFTSGDKWLVMCTNLLDADSVTRSFQSRLNLVTDSDVTYQLNETVDNASVNQLLHTFVRPINVSGTTTFECEAQVDSSGDSSQRLYSSIFAINLDKFNEDEGHFEEPSQAVPDITPDYQLMDTFTFAPDHTADYLVLACINLETDTLGDSYFGLRYQANNVDQPPSQTSQNLTPADTNEAGGSQNFCSFSIEPYTRAVAVTIDIDGSESVGGGNTHADRTIQFISLEDGFVDIDNPMTMTDTVSFNHRFPQDPMTMTDNVEFDVSIFLDNPITMTDDERLDVSIRLENPMTMTDEIDPVKTGGEAKTDDEQDPMTMTDTVSFNHRFPQDPITMTDEQHYDITVTPQDPITMTDEQRYDISIIIENPMTMTTDERFDTSIRLDNPITMTDDMNMIDRTQFAIEEDPLTLTDEQNYDISIRLDNPMTMTDDQRLDISIRIEDTMTMTTDERFDTSIRLDDPITMTDDMNMIDRTQFATEEDPLTLTDEQHYDITVTPEDPLTITDVQRYDISIIIENPMTMTDDVTPTKFLNALKQDPMTITDDQRFDISIMIEDPMTMTDEQHYDITVTPEDPMTMTDVTTFVRTINDTEEDPMTITDDQRFDISIRIENPMTMTDTTEPDANRVFSQEDPMTMTDDMNMIDRTQFTSPEDPMTMTDNQRYDISIRIDDPMTMTDDQRFDTSIRLDNPITITDDERFDTSIRLDNPMTMTDDMNMIDQNFVDAEQDPITMTDDLRFDTSIRLDNPITMTDIMTPDHTVASGDFFKTIENPLTWTEVLTLLCTGICVPPTPPSGGGDPTPIDPDSDGDGFIDSEDVCPLVIGVAPDGCPVPVIEEPLDELPLLDLTFPLEFNELDIVDDFIILETQFAQPQVEDLGIRWLSDEQITITSIEIGQSPFEIKVENIPVTIGDESFGFTQTQLIYTVQEPDKICGVNTTVDCLDEVTYEIPVKITGISDGKTIIADGSITIDNSGRTNPYWLALFGLVAVPILALLFWKRRKVKPKKQTLLKITNSKTVKDQKEKTKALKSGTTRKLLKDEKSSVLRMKIK